MLYFAKLKGRQLHNTKVTLQFKMIIGSLSPTEEGAFLCFLASLSIPCIIVPMAPSSAFHLLLPNSDPLERSCPF